MTVEMLARELGLWENIRTKVEAQAAAKATLLLKQLAGVPVRPSRATRSLGAYVSRAGVPICIRIQFAQEPEIFRQTLLHEIAHVCDHLCRLPGERYRQGHGPGWQLWAQSLGIGTERRGSSETVQRLHQSRLKPVAVCQRCGAELRRVRRLNRRQRYFHVNCGGRLLPL